MSYRLHTEQSKILHQLLFANQLKYSDMKPEDMEGSQFTYHLKQLLQKGYIEHTDDFYVLTIKGKEFANQMDTDKKVFKKQAKVSNLLAIIRYDNKQKVIEQVLMYKRLKNPFYGLIGHPTRKFWYGQEMSTAAEDAIEVECGLTGEAETIGTLHFLIEHQGQIVEDKIFHIQLFINPHGEIVNGVDGEYFWTDYLPVKADISKNPGKYLDEATAANAAIEQYLATQKLTIQEHKILIDRF